jgi:hypothetical protein
MLANVSARLRAAPRGKKRARGRMEGRGVEARQPKTSGMASPHKKIKGKIVLESKDFGGGVDGGVDG